MKRRCFPKRFGDTYIILQNVSDVKGFELKSPQNTAVSDGTLYLRINDDILGDNQGSLTVVVTVEKFGREE